jgi:tetratricopeptide (TPR) repeat protein
MKQTDFLPFWSINLILFRYIHLMNLSARIMIIYLFSLAPGMTGSLKAQSADQLFDNGTMLFIEKHFAEAEQMLKGCLHLEPKFAEAWRLLGKIRTEQKRFKEAIAFHKKATKLQPQNAEYLTLQAWNWQQLGKAKTAMRLYSKATRADSNYHHAWLYGGRLLQEQQQYAVSIHWAQKATRTEILSSEGYSLYGIGLLLTDKTIEAYNQFETAVRLDPKDVEAMMYKGLALEAISENEKALRVINQACILHPTDTILQLHRLRLEAKSGSAREGNMNPILETIPEAQVHLALKWVHKDVKEAEKLLNSVEDNIADNSLAQEIKGLILFYQGEYSKAMAQHRKVLKMKEPRPDLEFLKLFCRVLDDDYFEMGERKYSCDKSEQPFILFFHIPTP